MLIATQRENLLNNKKAFTLIELLAIIIILAIISVITISIILNVIDKTKQGAIINSAYGYLDAIDKFSITSLTDNQDFELNGTYIIENGKLSNYEIAINGLIPKTGRLVYQNGEFVSGTLQFDDYIIFMSYDKNKIIKDTLDIHNLSVEEQEEKIDGLYNSEYDEGRLVYKGSNPNNYIWLDEDGNDKKTDDELYRIISYEIDGTIKVIRNNHIGTREWDKVGYRNAQNGNTYCDETFGCNVWGNQYTTYYEGKTLDELYHSFHYKYFKSASTTDLTEDLIQKEVIDESSLNNYLNNTWLNQKSISDLVEEHSFDVGGIYYYKGYNNGDKGLLKEKKEQGLYKWYGKVGLMYITDEVESSTNDDCTSVYSNFYWNPKNSSLRTNGPFPCKIDNWLFINYQHDWTITSSTASNHDVWFASGGNGAFAFDNYFYGLYYGTNIPQWIRPSFFLRKDIVFYGEGTKDHPYIIENF